jgi:hypothetical protein
VGCVFTYRAAEQAYRAAELRPARLAVAAAGVLTDMAKCKAGRTALLEERQFVLHLILPPLEAALSLKGMHQVQQRVVHSRTWR